MKRRVTGTTDGTLLAMGVAVLALLSSALPAAGQTGPPAVTGTAPSFGTATVESRLYDTGTAITPIVLPEATGGDGTVSYTLAPAKLPRGLTWTASTRTIAGTPAAVTAAATYTWTATDADGDTAALTFSMRVWAPAGPAIDRVELLVPAVNQVPIHNYRSGQTIHLLVRYPEKMAVTGTPQLTLVIGDKQRKAGYDATRTAGLRRLQADATYDRLFFAYTVQPDDFDGDGIAVPADALSRNGGTIRAADDAADAKLSLGTHAIASGDATSVKMRVRDTAPSFSGAASAANRSLAKDAATATTLPLATGGDGALTYRISPALPRGLSLASASPKITGTPTVAGATTHTLTATDADGDRAALGPFTVTVVDGAPAVSGVAIVSKPYANATYGLGEVIRAAVSFDRRLTWTNISRSRLSLDVGGNTREARYQRFLGNAPLYEYTVQAADRDADGIGIGADALALNGATITDSATGVPAVTVLGTHAVANAAAHKVDGSVATPLAVKSVMIESSPAGSDGYDVGEVIKARVTFSRPVRINGSPRLALTIGANTRQAAAGPYSGPATQLYWDSMLFSYTVTAQDRDSNGIGIGASALTLNGATIRDAGGATPSLGLGTRAIADDSAHKVHTPPRITGVSIISGPGANGTYDAGETITVEFSWSEQVIFGNRGGNGGEPQVALTIGANTRRVHRDQAAVSRGHWYRYSYTVTASDQDLDGISVGANALTLPAGVRLYALNDNERADLSLGTHAITNDSGHTVRDSRPSFAAAAARRYLLNAAVSDQLPAATGGDGTVAYTLTGPGAATSLSLPDGLIWNAATRTISGTPTAAAAAASYTLTATDGDRDSAAYVFAPLGDLRSGGERRAHHLQPGFRRRLPGRRDDHRGGDLRPDADGHRNAAPRHRRWGRHAPGVGQPHGRREQDFVQLHCGDRRQGYRRHLHRRRRADAERRHHPQRQGGGRAARARRPRRRRADRPQGLRPAAGDRGASAHDQPAVLLGRPAGRLGGFPADRREPVPAEPRAGRGHLRPGRHRHRRAERGAHHRRQHPPSDLERVSQPAPPPHRESARRRGHRRHGLLLRAAGVGLRRRRYRRRRQCADAERRDDPRRRGRRRGARPRQPRHRQ